jgi:hypothetical protein
MLISFWCFQIGDQACKGNAALWASWHWKNSYGSSNWKNAEWEGAKGLELIPWFSSLFMFVCLLICRRKIINGLLQLVSPEIYVFIIYAYLHTKEFYSI